MIGESLLHYKVLSRLGKGGMGEVYRALDTKLQREVALKVLPPELATQPRRWERFVREVRTVAALNHPNIVTLYAVEETPTHHFFTMELVEGDTLGRLIPSGGVAIERFFELSLPLVAAVAAAHEKGITHRDLKPENVMVSHEGRVKVLDFGMAKAAEGSLEPFPGGAITEEGYVVGTARYMSPEQATGKPVDHRADIFALGIILYELATGHYPFQGRSAAEVLSSILRDHPVPATTLQRALPGRLGAIIQRCLEKNPSYRYATAGELRRELELVHAQSLPGELPIVEMERTWAEPRKPLVDPAPPSRGDSASSSSPLPRRGAGSARASGASVSRAPSAPALAVLPLADLSGQPDYFAEGLTDELITAVAKIGSLRVISRQSVMRYRKSTKLLPEIAREIGVDHVLEGSVLRAGDRVRISLQLLRADPEENLWAERFDRELKDVLALHSEVARAVAAEIEVALTPQDEVRLAANESVPPEVLEAYLKGRYYLNKRTQESLEKAAASFEEAILSMRLHAPSHAGMADALALLAHRASDRQLAERARASALRALEIDPALAEAHASLGFIRYFFDWDWAGAERDLQRALELAPNLAAAHHWYWSLLVATGRRGEARREILRAYELDPLAPVIVTNVGLHYYMCGELERSLRYFRQARELDSGFPGPDLCSWRAYEHLGNHAAAVEALSSALHAIGLGELAARMQQRHAERGYGEAMELAADELSRRGVAPLPLESVAWMYLANERTDQALTIVENAFARRLPVILWLAAAPDWRPVRDDPRFAAIVSAVGLPTSDHPR